jgi:penicillin-binding protein 1A
MERTLTKQRILELYLNCIEYGMKLYGIANAARHYFGKTVDQLTPLEIAFLMHLKTTPKEAWYLHKRGALPQRWRDALAYRMRNFKRKGWITDEQYDAAAPFDPIAHPEPTATAPEVPM